MTHHGNSFISFGGVIVDMGDLEFLSDKCKLGDLIIVASATGLAVTGALVSYIPANGKTFSLAGAVWTSAGTASGGATANAQLRNNGVIREYANNSTTNREYQFITKGDCLVGDGAKVYDVYAVHGGGATAVGMKATLLGWIDDT